MSVDQKKYFFSSILKPYVSIKKIKILGRKNFGFNWKNSNSVGKSLWDTWIFGSNCFYRNLILFIIGLNVSPPDACKLFTRCSYFSTLFRCSRFKERTISKLLNCAQLAVPPPDYDSHLRYHLNGFILSSFIASLFEVSLQQICIRNHSHFSCSIR